MALTTRLRQLPYTYSAGMSQEDLLDRKTVDRMHFLSNRETPSPRYLKTLPLKPCDAKVGNQYARSRQDGVGLSDLTSDIDSVMCK